ncbi:AEC family transporter [Microbulbifer sp. OS29]|uniref:AEC family transporter n=1 Tax=Microbulbifer okhotskensis TaxID=2926617 RepID=A0A9X2EPR5_9GAMM|nr:AEC family transporter [Microbulbifer okhotskensis]MCO1336187.1 AEC family transporter [Microbulbifer okhotskensis]
MENIAFALLVTGPIFLMIIGGYLLARQGMLRKSFFDDATVLVFNILLPALLFDSLYSSSAKPSHEAPLLIAGVLGTFAIMPIAWLTARPITVKDRSAFIQGAFRGNVAIVGLAWVEKAFGPAGVSHSAVLVAALTIQFNIFAVMLFVFYNEEKEFGPRLLLTELVKNPLLIGVFLAILCRVLNIKVPQMVLDTVKILGSASLPLGLICIGASMKLGQLLRSSTTALTSSLLKLIVVPILSVTIGWAMGMSPTYLGYLMLITGSPCGISAFVMAHTMGGNSQLAANIIGLSTVLSVISASIGLALLKVYI